MIFSYSFSKRIKFLVQRHERKILCNFVFNKSLSLLFIWLSFMFAFVGYAGKDMYNTHIFLIFDCWGEDLFNNITQHTKNVKK